MEWRWWLRMALILTLASTLSGCDRTPTAQRVPTTAAVAEGPASRPANPEDAIRDLWTAMLAQDESAVRKLILPNPDAQVLWGGEPVPPEHRETARKSIAEMSFREVHPGDHFSLPDGRTLVVTEDMVSADRCLLQPIIDGQAMPVPFSVCRVDATWKVDAGPLIAARLAAKANRQKARPTTTRGS